MKALMCCSNTRPYLEVHPFDLSNSFFRLTNDSFHALNGKIVVECEIEIEEIKKVNYDCILFTNTLDTEDLINKSSIDYFSLEEYLKPNWSKEDDLKNLDTVGYAIHIKNLHIFDKPRQLSDFELTNNCCFEKEVGRNWDDEPIYECKNPNACKYKDDCAPVCDKHFYPLERVNNMTKVFDLEKCEWSFVISCNSEELSDVFDKRKEIIVRKKVLKEML